MKEKVPFMIIFVLLVGSFFTGILIAVDHYTSPIVERNKRIEIKRNVLEALGIPCERGAVEQAFSDNVKAVERDGRKFYESREGSLAFTFEGSGLWGPISGVIALQPGLRSIEGLTIIHQEETPGLGGRIEDRDFLNEFRGKSVVPGIRIVPPGRAVGANEVDGITAATMTSNALQRILNREIKENLEDYEAGARPMVKGR